MEMVIEQRFWICFVLAIVLIPVGWWMGSSDLANEITTAVTDIENVDKAIPQGNQHPNQTYIAGVEKRVEARRNFYGNHAKSLSAMQEQTMDWPATVEPAMVDVDPVTSKKVRKKFGEKGNFEDARSYYRTAYYKYMADVYDIVDPIGIDPQTGNPIGYDPKTEKVSGKVVFDYNIIPKVPEDRWTARAPEWSEMWDAQRDAWLTKVLLHAIRRTNERRGTKNVIDAPIKQILGLTFRGGKRSSGNKGGDANKEQGGADAAPAAKLTNVAPKAGAAGFGRGADGILNTELGPEQPRKSAKKQDAATAEPAAIAPGDNSQKRDAMSPYVDNDPGMPFKTRGFGLQLLMKRKDLPLFIQELTDASKSKFPIEILRIHEIDQDQDHKGLNVLSQLGVRTNAGAGTNVPRRGRGIGGGEPPMAVDGGRTTNRRTRLPDVLQNVDQNGMGFVTIVGLITIYAAPDEPEKKAEPKSADPAPKKNPGTPSPKGKSPVEKKQPSPKSSLPVKKSSENPSPNKSNVIGIGAPSKNAGADQKTQPPKTKSPSTVKPRPSAVPLPKKDGKVPVPKTTGIKPATVDGGANKAKTSQQN